MRTCRMSFRVGFFCAVLLCFSTLSMAAPQAAMEGQRPVMLIGDVFRFVPGAWALYTIHDRVKNEKYHMHISTLEKTKCEERTCSWMEVEVTPESGASVSSRFLVEEKADGPGRIYEVVVQIKEYIPFIVPRKLYEGKEKEVGDFQSSYVAKKTGHRTIHWEGKSIPVTEVEATDKKDRKIKALVSEEVPPLGIVKAQTEKTDILLEKWGTGAKSRIEGTPVPIYLWLIKQLGQGLMK